MSCIQKLFSALLAAALLLQGSAIAFAAGPEVWYPEVYHLEGGIPDENGCRTPEYWADADGNRVVQSGGRVRAAASLPAKYDLRDQGVVTSAKMQAGAGNCWAFATIAALESSYIKQGYGTVSDTDFSEAHLVWFAQRERTTNKKDPTYGDGLSCANPYSTGGNWHRVAATLMRGCGLQLEKNARWIESYDTAVLMKMEQPESERYVQYARMYSAEKICDKSRDAFKEKIMQNGAAILAYYADRQLADSGGIPVSAAFNKTNACYYQNDTSKMWNHYVTVVGWDDNYPKTNFNSGMRPKSNGAWLIKGSWSPEYGKNGYFWLSYEEPSLDEFVSFVAAPTDVYDHIYQYDGAFTSMSFPIPNVGKMANVFEAERTELLTHVAFISPNTVPINVTAEVYLMPEDGWYTGMHPIEGMHKIHSATTSRSGVEYGYTTLELAEPVLLMKGQAFTVILTMELDGSDVLIPVEGLTQNPPRDGIATYSGSVGDSFVGYMDQWFDTNDYPGGDYNNVPLKAMTCDVTLVDPTLALATPPNRTTYRVGDTLDATGLSLAYTDLIGRPSTVTSDITCSPTALTEIGTQTVTATYDGLSVTFDVTVEPYTPTLSLTAPPDRTVYRVGDAFDPAGLALLYTDEYNRPHTVTDGFTCDPSTLSVIGTQTVTAAYKGLSVPIEVTAEPYETTLTLLTAPDKTTYMVGDTLDSAGLALLYTDEYNVPHTVTEGFVCSPQTLREIGTQTVSATYKGLSVPFDVTAEPYETTLTLRDAPFKTKYLYGETLNTAGLTLVYTDEYADAHVVTEGFVCDVETLCVFGTQTVTATYNGLSVTFDVRVNPHEPTLTLASPPDKTTYLFDEPLDTDGLTLLYRDEYGEEHTVTEGFYCDYDSLDLLGVLTVTVTYNNLTVTFDVIVEPYEPTLTLASLPDRTTYRASETLDTTGLSLVYTDEFGMPFTVTERFTCVPYTLRALGTQTVTVTYNGLSVAFDVTVEPLEPTLTLRSAPDKTDYLFGEMLDTTGLTLVYTDEIGDALVVTEGFACDPTYLAAVGSQSVSVTYNGLCVTFDVTVELRDPVLTILTLPDKTRYFEGDTLDMTGLQMLYSDEYGKVTFITDGYSYQPVTFYGLGYRTITVGCFGLTVSFDVKVILMEPTLEIGMLPDKTTYLYDETLDTTGLTLLYTDDLGEVMRVTEGIVCMPVTFSALGTQTIEAAYAGLTVTFDVTVEPLEPTLTVQTPPDTTVYMVGETLDPTGLSLVYTDEYGDALVVTENFTCDPMTLSDYGMQTVTVTYRDLSAVFSVTVRPYEPMLTVAEMPDTTTYLVGDLLDTTGLVLCFTDEYNEPHSVTYGYLYEPRRLSVIGTQTVTVTYSDFTATFDVTVEPYETTLELLTEPDRMTYMVGDTLETDGLSLLYSDEYGTEYTVTEWFVCTPQTLRTIGTQTVTVTYNTKTVTFDVTVEPYEPTLTLLSAPLKTTYLYGETLDPTGLSLVYTDAYNEAHAVTGDFDCDVATFDAFGTQPVTVTYMGLSVTFDATVEPHEPTLTLVSPPDRTAYLYGETIDTTGLTLQYKDIYGTVHTVTEGYDCDVEAPDLFGRHTVSVTYMQLSVTFDVTVDPHEPTLALLTPPDKTNCPAALPVDTTGLTMLYTDEYGQAHTVTEGFTIAPETMHTLGTQTVTVTYKELSVTFDVTVEPVEPTLTLQFAPAKTTYVTGEKPDTTGLTLFYTNEVGDATIVTSGFSCSPDRFLTAGEQAVTVTYKGLSVTFDVTVELRGTRLTLRTKPDRTAYHIGDTLDTAGLSLTYTDAYGDTHIVTAGFSCDPTTLSALGTQTVTVTYQDLTVSFDVTVEAYTPTLTIRTPPNKTTYFVGETLDTTGLSLVYTDAYGKAMVVTQNFVCSPQTMQQSTKSVRVSYADLSVTFSVTVRAVEPVSLKVVSLPTNSSYVYRSRPDFAGLVVSVQYNDGHEEIVRDLSRMTIQLESNQRMRRGTQTFRVSVQGVSDTFTMQVRLAGWQWVILILLFGWLWY